MEVAPLVPKEANLTFSIKTLRFIKLFWEAAAQEEEDLRKEIRKEDKQFSIVQ